MNIGSLFAKVFEKMPEWPLKNNLRYFLAFSPLVPKFISDLSPVKGYEMYRKLKEGDIVIDAGAYPGDYAVFASKKVGRTGKIIAFEPDPKNRKVLRKNLERLGLRNYIIVPKGLWNENKILKLKNSNGLHSELLSNEGKVEIPVVRLDDELRRLKIKKVDVIKMDIEGAEIGAIKGCVSILKRDGPYIAIASYHKVNGKETNLFLEKFLEKFGYYVKSDFPKHLTTFAWKD